MHLVLHNWGAYPKPNLQACVEARTLCGNRGSVLQGWARKLAKERTPFAKGFKECHGSGFGDC
jgi:hypothetical protein